MAPTEAASASLMDIRVTQGFPFDNALGQTREDPRNRGQGPPQSKVKGAPVHAQGIFIAGITVAQAPEDSTKKECRHFQKGVCRFGADCRHLHPGMPTRANELSRIRSLVTSRRRRRWVCSLYSKMPDRACACATTIEDLDNVGASCAHRLDCAWWHHHKYERTQWMAVCLKRWDQATKECKALEDARAPLEEGREQSGR